MNDIKPVFLKWEKLRIPYNIILTLVVLGLVVPIKGLPHFTEITNVVMGAVLANLCFFAAPIVEAYMGWLGYRFKWTTPVLFMGGVLISIPCVFAYMFFSGLGPR